MTHGIPRSFIISKLSQAGFITEDGIRTLAAVIDEQLPAWITPRHSFFNFKKTIQDYANEPSNKLNYEQAKKMAAQFPAMLFNWHDIPYKDAPKISKSAKQGKQPALLDLDAIEAAIRLELPKSENIIYFDRTVTSGPYKSKTWAAINAMLGKYASTNPNCGFSTIYNFMQDRGIEGSVKYGPHAGKHRLSAAALFNGTIKFFNAGNAVPNLYDENGKLGAFKLANINRAFKEASIDGVEAFTPEGKAAPKNLRAFLLVSGLCKIQKNKLVPASPLPQPAPLEPIL